MTNTSNYKLLEAKDGTESMIARKFLLERLPDPLEPSHDHLQIFENYVEHTSLRLRSVRHPATDRRKRTIERSTLEVKDHLEIWNVTRMGLEAEEYGALKPLKGREIRKNRYYLSSESVEHGFDIYLGELWGLIIASVEFDSIQNARQFELPAFSVTEITGREFFRGPNLVDRDFSDVQREFSKAKDGN